ncbi:MAG: cyclic nucleotide-binding domain protein [Micavibrio sp.]|nr:cyclic nucleotide-binding domain protein [Micavibrio sp.]
MEQSKHEYKAGQTIMQQGDKGESAYIIEEGTVEIYIERNGRIQNVGTRGPGALIGEMAIVDDAPRTATIRALQHCKLLEITRDDFANRLESSDPVLQMISQVILTRYRDMLARADILGEGSTFPPPELMEQEHAAQMDVIESIKIGNEFQKALAADNELSLHYQPIINLQTGQVAGFEALMRWIHPEKGFISPGVFIPIVEKNGMIIEASRWGLRESCKALKRIESKIGREENLFMSVNFSSADFASENFLDHVYQILSETDVRAEHLKLEITERLLIQQPDNAKEVLEMCRAAGMSIAIDDFGTGYSSLSYLYYFPIDTLKIDQSFVRAMTREAKSLELVRSIVGLGKNLKMKIVAEGVETVEEARILRDMGCDLVQGYYFAKPLPENDVTELLKSWRPKDL